MLLALTACSGGSSELDPTPNPTPAAKVPINISTSILSRATDLAFEAGDQIGLFVVNHQADGSAATLQTTGNYIDKTTRNSPMMEPGRLQLQPTGKTTAPPPISTFIIHIQVLSAT